MFGSAATPKLDLAYEPAIIITRAKARVVFAFDKAKSTIPVIIELPLQFDRSQQNLGHELLD